MVDGLVRAGLAGREGTPWTGGRERVVFFEFFLNFFSNFLSVLLGSSTWSAERAWKSVEDLGRSTWACRMESTMDHWMAASWRPEVMDAQVLRCFFTPV